jgi:hypothetical protein
MKIDYDGQVYDWDDEALTVAQGLAIEKHTGGTLLDWDQGLLSARTDCYQALYWVVLRGGDPGVKIAALEFPVLKFARAYITARNAEIEALAAEAEAAVTEAEAQVAANGEDPTPQPAPRRSRPG